MKHTESEYINAGYRFERANSPDAARAQAQRIRTMIESEPPDEQPEARRLIEQGRREARA
jgi:hypothetical protein